MTFEAPQLGVSAALSPPELPQDWMTAAQIMGHPAMQDTCAVEVRDVTNYLADGMVADAEDPVVAKSELVRLFRQTGEENSAPRSVIAYRPDLARAVITFFEEQTEKAVDATIYATNAGIVEAVAAGVDTEEALRRIKGHKE